MNLALAQRLSLPPYARKMRLWKFPKPKRNPKAPYRLPGSQENLIGQSKHNKPKAKNKAFVKWRWPGTQQTATDTKSRCPEENYNLDLEKQVVRKSS